MSGSNFTNLLKSYSNKAKPPKGLEMDQIIAGSNVKDKLENLMKSRTSSALSPSFPDFASLDTIVICVVIVDILHHEDIWRCWFEEAGTKGFKFEIIIHAKHPEKIKSPWVKDRTLKKSFRPEWNSIEVVRALLLLLQEGLKIRNAGRFVFATESCIPIHSPEHTHNALFQDDVSWLNSRHSIESKWEAANCFRAVDSSIIPEKAVWKSLPGWIMLTRRHAYEIVCLPSCVGYDLVKAWGPSGTWTEWSGGVFAPEEVYFPTMLSMLGYLRDKPVSSQKPATDTASKQTYHDEVKRQMVTYAEFKRVGDANPINFEAITLPLFKKLRESGALFARKFHPSSCYFSDWLNVMKLLDSPLSVPSVSLDATAATTMLTTSLEVENQKKSEKVSDIAQEQSIIESSDTNPQSASITSDDGASPDELDGSNSSAGNKRARHS